MSKSRDNRRRRARRRKKFEAWDTARWRQRAVNAVMMFEALQQSEAAILNVLSQLTDLALTSQWAIRVQGSASDG